MKRFLAVFALFTALIFVVSCGGSLKSNKTSDSTDTGETETDEDSADSESDDTASEQSDNEDPGRKQGELYGECYPNATCNKGLVCDEENNICIKDPNDSGSDSDNDAAETDDDSDSTPEQPDNEEPDSDSNTSDTTSDSGDSQSDDDTTDSGNDSDEPDADTLTDPCDPTPCLNVANSTGECIATGNTTYSCKCNTGYNWTGTLCQLNSSGGTKSLGNICTGQDKCFNNENEEITCPNSSTADFFGQDAYYASLGTCTPQSFTVQTISNQKVVIDNNTGLMWQQTLPTSPDTWSNAGSYCNLTYAGYSDWRLPTPNELLTIVDISKSPAIDMTYFPDMPGMKSFWCSSFNVGQVPIKRAWCVNFAHGGLETCDMSMSWYFRCVR